MSQKVTKLLRRHANSYELPKPYFRKVLKMKQQYKLDLTQSLYLIDVAAKQYYDAMENMSDQIEKELDDGSE